MYATAGNLGIPREGLEAAGWPNAAFWMRQTDDDDEVAQGGRPE